MNRVIALIRAQLSGEVLGERTPVAALAMQAVIATLLCLLVRGEVGAYGYVVFALSIPLALTAVPLLGELAPLLRADPAAEWVGAQPVSPRDLRLARVGTLLIIVGMLSLAALIPAALLAPAELGAAGRALLVVAGLVQTWCLAAALLALQVLLHRLPGRGGESFLVLLQTAVFLAVLVGALVGLRSLPILDQLTGAEPGLLAFPPAWFASFAAPAGWGVPGAIAATVLIFAAVVFLAAPFPPAPRAQSTHSVLSILLTPFRGLAELVWVRSEERAPFSFVYDALPAEREFVLRTYPLVAAPLLFLALGADPTKVEGEGLFALLLFAPAAYLPFVLMHVPTTATPAARWIVDTAPIDDRTENQGARKAVAVRLLVPLYLGIGALVMTTASPSLGLRLWPVAVAVGLVTLRILVARGMARPLSTPANDLLSTWNEGLGGTLMTLAVVMTLIAVAAWRTIPSPLVGWAILGAVVLFELTLGNRTSSRGRLGVAGE
ncbi:hypothetical protein Poly30_50800 [Planctomycetes bacterium Poly30]|uniref:Uncharacterized protein n=1 Tax=Saltatorellus ferox TaxID=2528018 RepID=A0A518EZL1_9BACT|nr:hypothetical protein Poly30_50800 [Planctomycetes bacterium Poly30]